jgi:hypothetical protein
MYFFAISRTLETTDIVLSQLLLQNWAHRENQTSYDKVSIISGTGTAICTLVVVARCNGAW